MQTAGMFGPYRLIYALKKQRRLQPSGLVAITIRANNEEEIVTYKDAGSFIFEVLREYHIDENAKILNDHGLQVAQDLRVWNTASFHITTGGGDAADQGMTAHTLWPLALNLLNYHHHAAASGPLLGCLIEPSATQPLILHQHPAASNITGWQLWLVLHQGHWLLLELHAPPALAPVGVAKFYNAHTAHSSAQQLQHLLLDLEKSLHIKIILNNNKGGRDQAHPATCGTVLLGNLAHALQIHHLWPSNQDEELHAGILQAFPQIHQQHIGRGPAEESVVLRAIETILHQKGVPTTRVRERAQAALKKIGLQELQQIVLLKNPWPAMKSVASRPSINFMWVAHDELQAQIREKAEDKFKIQSSKRKTTRTSKDAPPPLLQVEPHLLRLAPNTFVHQNQPVTQIDLGALSTATNGIAFGSVADVLPYLKEGKPINNTAVGVLTTTPVPAERCGLLPVRHLRYPALYTPTGEPLLIAGSLILLGQGSIDRADHSGGPSFEIMATQTLRFSVYKDQWTGTWELFLQKPVRELIQKFPILRLCKEESCGDSCPFYHPPVDEAVDNVIMDLWSRTWLSAEGKFCKPENAAYWTVLARVPKFVQHSLQGLSATAGRYVEPRTSGGKEADPAYAMVWLGNISVGAAMHKCRTTPTAIAVMACACSTPMPRRRSKNSDQRSSSSTRKQPRSTGSFRYPSACNDTACKRPSRNGDGKPECYNPSAAELRAAPGRLQLRYHLQLSSCRRRRAMSSSPLGDTLSRTPRHRPSWLLQARGNNFTKLDNLQLPPLRMTHGSWALTRGHRGPPTATSPRRTSTNKWKFDFVMESDQPCAKSLKKPPRRSTRPPALTTTLRTAQSSASKPLSKTCLNSKLTTRISSNGSKTRRMPTSSSKPTSMSCRRSSTHTPPSSAISGATLRATPTQSAMHFDKSEPICRPKWELGSPGWRPCLRKGPAPPD